MARARNIKPGFFKNYYLADLGPMCQLLFAGLWCLADKEGRLEDKPRFIKAELFPYYDCDVNGELTKLERLGFVSRFSARGMSVIEIANFKKHQSPHHTEKASDLPCFDERDDVSDCFETEKVIHGDTTVSSPLEDGGNPPDSLIPDSLIPDSIKKSARKRAATPDPSRPDDVDEQTWADWLTLRRGKKASVTVTVLSGARCEADKAGIPLQRFLQVWCLRGSQGLQADWLTPAERGQHALASQPAETTYQRSMRERWEEATGRRSDGRSDGRNVIDITPTQELLP